MKITQAILFIIIISLCIKINAQEISHYLFGQNYWMENNSERQRPGYINKLWPQVEESGIKMVRIGESAMKDVSRTRKN